MTSPNELLQQVQDLPAEIQQRISEAMHMMKFRRGDRITSVSEIRDNIFYITKGSARVYYTLSDKEHTFAFAFENEVLLISKVLLNFPMMMVTIEFLEPTEVVMIESSSLDDTFKALNDPTYYSSLAAIGSAAFVHYSRYLEERVLMLQNTSALSRYRWMIKRYPRILERATMTQVASFLGITRETLYRIRSGKYSPRK